MKRFLLFISALFICNIAIADDITINWSVDNQPYTTTTCEIGGDVVLPSVSKRGHVFRGWKKNYDRGMFDNWASVPSNTNQYLADTNNNRTPLENDYIIVEDSSEYTLATNKIVIKRTVSNLMQNIEIYYNNIKYDYDRSVTDATNFANNAFTIQYKDNYYITFNKFKTVFENNTYGIGDRLRVQGYGYTGTRTGFELSTSLYSGTWRFVYDGVWETDGKTGWKPVEQIISE